MRIERELGVRIPADFVKLATACPSYGTWFASIGNDFDRPSHIIMVNALFHDARQLHDGNDGPALPAYLVMLNHGHDGDCDCWDTRVLAAAGERPIVYVRLDAPERLHARFATFRSYIEHLAVRHARSVADKAQRRRAKRLIDELGLS